MNHLVFFTSEDKRFETVQSIRTAVFISEQGANADEEFDAYDSSCIFALLYEDDRAVGTARIAKTDKGFKIGRIAILRDCRGKGYGAVLVNAVTDKAFCMGADTVYVDAQNYAVGFYEKLGFRVIGTEIIDRGLAHIPMSRQCEATRKGDFNETEKE